MGKKEAALIQVGGILISSPACRKLRSHHAHPNSMKKAEQTENQQLFLKPSEK